MMERELCHGYKQFPILQWPAAKLKSGSIVPQPVCNGDALSCGLARLHGFIGGKPIQVTVSHGPGIEPCRCSGNTVLDA